ncbi:facilitated trehalose transporter Tret1-like [Culicoides brevitarsis]|uniref:facilitated trehalose transporter Tret1-like n=1 Tax=Culicoides brevitarsis TaxID=469753 RepID=UPI00307CAA4C
MGFHNKITTQDSVKSIISHQSSTESSASYTCCGIRIIGNDNKVNSTEENSTEATTRSNIFQQIFLYVLAISAFLPCGASLAWSSNFLFSHWNDEQLLSTSTSWMVASLPFSAAVASLLSFKMCHIIGTRRLIILSTVIMSLSWQLILLQRSLIQCDYLLYAARIFGGFGLGSIMLTIPKYMQDLLPSSHKNFIYKSLQSAVIFGAMIEYVANDIYEISTILMIIFPIFAVLGFAFFPESPQTLVHQQNYAKARKILQVWLAEKEENEIMSKMQSWSIAEQRGGGDGALRVMFKSRSWVETLVPLFGLVIFEALLGVMAIMFYLKPIVFAIDSDGFLPISCQLIAICAAMLLGMHLKPLLCCHLNAKSQLLFGITIIFLNFGLLGTFYHTTNLGITALRDNLPYLPVVCFTAIGMTYTCSITSGIQTYLKTLTLPHTRFACRATSHAIAWLITGILCAELSHVIWYIGVGWLFYNMAIISVFMMCFVLLLLPRLIKDVMVIDVASDGSEISTSDAASEHSKISNTASTSTDITMENVLVV